MSKVFVEPIIAVRDTVPILLQEGVREYIGTVLSPEIAANLKVSYFSILERVFDPERLYIFHSLLIPGSDPIYNNAFFLDSQKSEIIKFFRWVDRYVEKGDVDVYLFEKKRIELKDLDEFLNKWIKKEI